MGNQHFTKIYNSTNETLKVELELPEFEEKKSYEIPPGDHIIQPTDKGDVRIKLYKKNITGNFNFYYYFVEILIKFQNIKGEWNLNHVAKAFQPSDVNLIIKKQRKMYSFVRSKYGNIYAESSSP